MFYTNPTKAMNEGYVDAYKSTSSIMEEVMIECYIDDLDSSDDIVVTEDAAVLQEASLEGIVNAVKSFISKIINKFMSIWRAIKSKITSLFAKLTTKTKPIEKETEEIAKSEIAENIKPGDASAGEIIPKQTATEPKEVKAAPASTESRPTSKALLIISNPDEGKEKQVEFPTFKYPITIAPWASTFASGKIKWGTPYFQDLSDADGEKLGVITSNGEIGAIKGAIDRKENKSVDEIIFNKLFINEPMFLDYGAAIKDIKEGNSPFPKLEDFLEKFFSAVENYKKQLKDALDALNKTAENIPKEFVTINDKDKHSSSVARIIIKSYHSFSAIIMQIQSAMDSSMTKFIRLKVQYTAWLKRCNLIAKRAGEAK